jgi:hypothetical protein
MRAEIYVDHGGRDWNNASFDALLVQRETIEREFGESLEWERLDNKRALELRCIARAQSTSKKKN